MQGGAGGVRPLPDRDGIVLRPTGFQDGYRLVLLLFQYTTSFSREYKFTLGQDMKRDGIVLVRSIYRANKAKEKGQYLEQFLDDFELLKLEIRLAVDFHLITVRQQAEFTLLLSSIGKQMTGGAVIQGFSWIESFQKGE